MHLQSVNHEQICLQSCIHTVCRHTHVITLLWVVLYIIVIFCQFCCIICHLYLLQGNPVHTLSSWTSPGQTGVTHELPDYGVWPDWAGPRQRLSSWRRDGRSWSNVALLSATATQEEEEGRGKQVPGWPALSSTDYSCSEDQGGVYWCGGCGYWLSDVWTRR